MKARIADAVTTMQRLAGPSVAVSATVKAGVATFALRRFGRDATELDREARFTMPTAIRSGTGVWLTTLRTRFRAALQVLG